MTSPWAGAVELANVAQTAGLLVEHGLASADDVERDIAALREGSVSVVMPPMVAAFGRRP